MKKIFYLILIFFLTFTLTACGNTYIGKIVKKDMTRKFQTPTGKNHRYTLSHLIVNYNYKIDPAQQSISIKGTVDDRQQDSQAHFVQDAGWTLQEAYLDIYFLNAKRIAVDVCRKNFPPGHFAFPYPFEATCRYSPEYRYAALSYMYKYIKYGKKAKAQKIYQHRLDIQ